MDKDSLKNLEGNEFYVLYQDKQHTWGLVSKAELPEILKCDPIKPIRYIFDVTDRIVVSREMLIDTDIKEG